MTISNLLIFSANSLFPLISFALSLSLDEPIILEITLNDTFYDKLEIVNKLKYSINLSRVCKQNSYLKIDFFVQNTSSLYDLKKGLNRKKRSIVINKINLLN